MMRRYTLLLLLCAVFLAGCNSQGTQDDVAMEEQRPLFTIVVGNPSSREVENTIEKLNVASAIDQEHSFQSFSAEKNELMDQFDNSIRLKYNQSKAYAQDTISYDYKGETKEYRFPYARVNLQKLGAPECSDESLYDSILCYMPRVDGFYGPFASVFAPGTQIVYTVSAYQSLSEQHILDLASKKEFPQMDSIYLLYRNGTNDKVVAGVRGKKALFSSIESFANGKKTTVYDDAASSVFYDGTHLYVTSTDYASQSSNVFVYDLTTMSDVASFSGLDIGESAEFVLEDDHLLVYYVDVSFVEEKEFFYVASIDRQTMEVERSAQVHQ